jgi:hypothetical protein
MVHRRVRVAANESPDKQGRPASSRKWHAVLQADKAYVAADVSLPAKPTNPADGEQVSLLQVLPTDEAIAFMAAFDDALYLMSSSSRRSSISLRRKSCPVSDRVMHGRRCSSGRNQVPQGDAAQCGPNARDPFIRSMSCEIDEYGFECDRGTESRLSRRIDTYGH